MINTNTFYKTFTGADALAFMVLPETKPILLGSLTSISHSVYREKKPVPLLGKINVGGFTRGMRSIAGTMVFTLINQHLVEDILKQVPYLAEHGKIKSDELPFFDIMIVCANEYGAASRMMIYGVEFFEEGQVVSIEDIYIENTFSFIARDLDDFTKIDTIIKGKNGASRTVNVDTVVPYEYSQASYDNSYQRTLLLKNKDMVNIQTALLDKGYTTPITGVLDNETKCAIYEFQKDNKLSRSGFVDDTTYSLLMNQNGNKDVLTITNKNGAYVYSNKDKDSILGLAKYQSNYLGTQDLEFVEIDFYDKKGYIEIDNTDAYVQKKHTIEEYPNKSNIVHTVKLADFDATKYGARYTCNKDTEVKISSISYYKNGESISNSRFYNLKANTPFDLRLSYIPSAYIYDIENKSMPEMVEFFIQPSGEKARKWIIKLK